MVDTTLSVDPTGAVSKQTMEEKQCVDSNKLRSIDYDGAARRWLSMLCNKRRRQQCI